MFGRTLLRFVSHLDHSLPMCSVQHEVSPTTRDKVSPSHRHLDLVYYQYNVFPPLVLIELTPETLPKTLHDIVLADQVIGSLSIK